MGAARGCNLLIFSIFVVLACSSQCIDGLRILGLFPLNGKSHFVMCETLAKGLAERGHQVDVYSHFPLKKPIPNYTDFSLAGTLPNVVNNLTFDTIKAFETGNVQMLFSEAGDKICELMSTPVFQQLFERLKKDQPYDVILVEIFVANCYIAWGRYLNIPIVGVMTSALIDWFNEPLGNPHNTAVNPCSWSPYQHPMPFSERLANTFLYKLLTTTVPYYVTSQDKYIEKYFGPGYPNSYDIIKDLDLLLINGHYMLNGINAYSPSIIPVAGIHIRDDNATLPQEVQKWLDESKNGCIYVSFGSMVRIETFPKPVINAFYEAFKKIAPVRVLVKIAQPKELPAGLPSNVITQSWVSQVKVLKHKNTKAFVTHGGLMSIQELLSIGVPMIGIPLYGDQHNNVKAQVKRKVATKVDVNDITADTLYTAINEILTNPIYKKNAEKFAKNFFDRPMKPMDTAAFWVEYIARHGRQALKSPIADLPWWQANLIDVYGFCLLVLIVLYYAVKLIIKNIFKLFVSALIGKKKRE